MEPSINVTVMGAFHPELMDYLSKRNDIFILWDFTGPLDKYPYQVEFLFSYNIFIMVCDETNEDTINQWITILKTKGLIPLKKEDDSDIYNKKTDILFVGINGKIINTSIFNSKNFFYDMDFSISLSNELDSLIKKISSSKEEICLTLQKYIPLIQDIQSKKNSYFIKVSENINDYYYLNEFGVARYYLIGNTPYLCTNPHYVYKKVCMLNKAKTVAKMDNNSIDLVFYDLQDRRVCFLDNNNYIFPGFYPDAPLDLLQTEHDLNEYPEQYKYNFFAYKIPSEIIGKWISKLMKEKWYDVEFINLYKNMIHIIINSKHHVKVVHTNNDIYMFLSLSELRHIHSHVITTLWANMSYDGILYKKFKYSIDTNNKWESDYERSMKKM